VDILFTVVGGPEHRKELFYREVSWPDEAPIPRIGENITLGTLFPCEITNIFWAVELPTNDINLLYQAVEEGFLLEFHPNFSI
jgi:hypothetical protein